MECILFSKVFFCYPLIKMYQSYVCNNFVLTLHFRWRSGFCLSASFRTTRIELVAGWSLYATMKKHQKRVGIAWLSKWHCIPLFCSFFPNLRSLSLPSASLHFCLFTQLFLSSHLLFLSILMERESWELPVLGPASLPLPEVISMLMRLSIR